MTATYQVEADTFAISQDRTQYIILDKLEAAKCSLDLIKFCPLLSPVIPVKGHQSCVIALYLNEMEAIKTNCKI